jgi:two-component system, OmpR family, phosphate regulon sensor histidine kinase PhoR
VKSSLYWKITIPFVVLILISMGILGLYTVNSVRGTQVEQLRSYLISEARLVANEVVPHLVNQDNNADPDTIAKNVGQEIDARVTIIDLHGNVLGDSWENPLAMENHSNRPEVISALSSGIGESIRYSTTTRQNMFYVAVQIVNKDLILGVARVSLPLTTVEEKVNHTIVTLILATGIAAFLVILAAAIITRMITRPVRKLTRAVLKTSLGNLDQQIDIVSSDELGRLSQAFNRMSVNLKDNMSAISDEKSKLDTVLATIADGIIMTDSQTRILLTNPAAESVFNFRSADALGRPLIEIILNYEIEKLLKNSLASGKKQNMEVDTTTGKYLRVIAVPIKIKSLSGALLNIQDLTELRNLQTVRREFVGNISHELRTPLAGIKAIVETLQNGAIDEKEVAQEFLSKVDAEVDSMTQMVNELIELSRIETGKVKLDLVSLDLNSVIKEVVERLAPLAQRKQIIIVSKLKENLPPVQADRERIQQVISNILHNAIKFTPANGEIVISTQSSSDSVSVQIRDNGIGISRDDLPHIFERFFKADKSRSSGGSGLGMAISKHIIKAHGGEIWVQSVEGKGSTFGFNLPPG